MQRIGVSPQTIVTIRGLWRGCGRVAEPIRTESRVYATLGQWTKFEYAGGISVYLCRSRTSDLLSEMLGETWPLMIAYSRLPKLEAQTQSWLDLACTLAEPDELAIFVSTVA